MAVKGGRTSFASLVSSTGAHSPVDGDAANSAAASPSLTSSEPAAAGVGEAPLEEFAHRPDNPRDLEEYDPKQDDDQKALTGTLGEYGVLQPVTVCSIEAWLQHYPEDRKCFKPPQKWVVMMGNRRLAAARHAQLERLPFFRVDVIAHPNRLFESGIIENRHRKDTNPVREALEFARILDHTGESRRALAERMQLSHSHINQRLALLELIEPFKDLVSRGTLTVQKALPIAALPHEKQKRLLELGPPYKPSQLKEADHDETDDGGNTLSTRKAVRIPKSSTPTDVVQTLASNMDAEMLKEVARLLADTLTTEA